jgi:nucleoside-diphosphate-sugar epimerase
VKPEGSGARLTSDFAGITVLVTGGSGFIGTRLCEALSVAGAIVHVVSRRQREVNVAAERWWTGDLSSEEETLRIIDRASPRFIFHLAGEVGGARELDVVGSMLRNNLVSTVNLMSAATRAGCDGFVLAGSMEEPSDSTDYVTPRSPYAAAKWAASGYARMFFALYSLPVTILRLFLVYGPGQRDSTKLVPYVIRSLLSGRPPRLTDGQRRIDWIYVDDVISAFMAAASTDHGVGKTIDVGSGRLVSIAEVVERIVGILGSHVEPMYGALQRRPLEHESVADTGPAQDSLNWAPTVDLKVGLKRTVEWYSSGHAPESPS